MDFQLLELPCFVMLAITGYAAWRAQRLARLTKEDRDRGSREIWEQVEGKVSSVTLVEDYVTVAYEFPTPQGLQEAFHRIRLEIVPPYVFGSRSADLAKAAEKYFTAFPSGCPATVRYNPKRVSQSVLSQGRTRQMEPARMPAAS